MAMAAFRKYTSWFLLAVGILAIVGGAVMPPLMGFINVKIHSLALAYSVPLVAYVVIAFYSFWGSHQRNSNLSAG